MNWLLCRLLFAVGSLPAGCKRALAGLVGWILSTFPGRERSVAELQLQVFLEIPAPQPLVRAVFRNVALTVLESLNLCPILASQPPCIRFEQWDEFQRWIRSGRGTVCLTGHVGNWDLLAAYMQQREIPFHALGRPARGRFAQYFLQALRARYHIRTIWRSDQSGVRAIMRELKEGRGIAALIDQDTAVASTMVPFFGHPAKTPSGLIEIGKRLNAQACSMFLIRQGSGQYRVIWKILDSSKTVDQILAAFHAELEAVIRAHPEQWVWFHKRWRSKLDGSTLGSAQYIQYLQGLLTATKT